MGSREGRKEEGKSGTVGLSTRRSFGFLLFSFVVLFVLGSARVHRSSQNS